VIATQVRFDAQALAAHVAALRSASAAPGSVCVRDAGALLESLRTGLSPADGAVALRVLAWQCASLGQYQASLQGFAAAIAHCAAMARGRRGRLRPAYLHVAEELLYEAVAMALPEPQGSVIRLRLLELFACETGRPAALGAVLFAVAAAGGEIADAACRRFCELLQPCRAAAPDGHAEALRRVALLRKAGDLEGSIDLATRHLAALPEWAVVEIAQCRFLRGTSLAADAERTAEALEDMRAAALLPDAVDRDSARRIADLLQRHLATAAMR
jgi:hypothetical protein